MPGPFENLPTNTTPTPDLPTEEISHNPGDDYRGDSDILGLITGGRLSNRTPSPTSTDPLPDLSPAVPVPPMPSPPDLSLK